MATTTGRVRVTSGQLVGADEINSLAQQGVQVFANRSARNTAGPVGLVWVINRNELQLWSGTKWLTLAQGTPTTPTTPVGVPRPRYLPGRSEDSQMLPLWRRPDHQITIPAALSHAPTYPTKRLPNPFAFDPIPLQNVFDNSTSTGGVLEFGQTSAVGAGVVRRLTAELDAEVHIVVVSPGSPGAPSTNRNDLTFNNVRVYLAGGGGGGGEIAETVIRVARGETIEIHGQHPGDAVWARHNGNTILHAATGPFSPGRGASQAAAGGGGYTAVGNAQRPTPTREPRFDYTTRTGGLCYEPGPAKGEYGTAGTGASFTANGLLGRWRGQYLTRPLNNVAVAGPVGVTLNSAHWNLTGNGATLQLGNGAPGYRTQYSFDGRDIRTRPTRYGEGGAGGYTGHNVLANQPRWGAYDGGAGCCLIRYSTPGTPLVADPVL